MHFKIACLLACLMGSTSIQAAISLNNTRVIFDGAHKEATIEVRNQGDTEVLLQSWLDTGKRDDDELPFAVSPPLAKASANGRQMLRLLYQGSGMPTDRESVVWLNVQEIPRQPDGDNVLQLAVRQRIKVFFRPVGLAGDAAQAPSQLQWKLQRNGEQTALEVHNPALFHVSLAAVRLQGDGYDSPMDDTTMIAPGERRQLPMKPIGSARSASLQFSSINDYGGVDDYQATVDFAQASAGKPAPAAPAVPTRSPTPPSPLALPPQAEPTSSPQS